MRLLESTWDFIFGAFLIGFAPVVAIHGTSVFAGIVIGDPKSLEGVVGLTITAVVFAMILCLPITAIWGALRWRLQHRMLPRWVAWIEAPVGLVCGSAFLMYAMAMHFFGYIE